MSRLCDLAQKYGTDKFVGGYTEFYDLILRSRKVETLLEIGIGTVNAMQHVADYKPGASLRMWEEYFPDADIFGVDIDENVLFNEGRIQTQVCDQTKVYDLVWAAKWAGGSLDLIVDDGNHNVLSQVLGVVTLMPFLSPDGLYIIEDINNPHEVTELLPFAYTVVQTHSAGGKRKGSLILIGKQ